MHSRKIFALSCALALAGCQTPAPRPHVSYRAVTNNDLRHYQLKPAQASAAPAQLPRNRVPVYPPALIKYQLPPVEVPALLIVDVHGRVTDARIGKISAVSAVDAKAFAAAVRTATLRWRFVPWHIDTWSDAANGDSVRIAADPKPFSQNFVFRFALRNGKPVVSAGERQTR